MKLFFLRQMADLIVRERRGRRPCLFLRDTPGGRLLCLRRRTPGDACWRKEKHFFGKVRLTKNNAPFMESKLDICL